MYATLKGFNLNPINIQPKFCINSCCVFSYITHSISIWNEIVNQSVLLILFCLLLSSPLPPKHLLESKTNRLSNLINPSDCQDLNLRLQRNLLVSPSWSTEPEQQQRARVDCLDPHHALWLANAIVSAATAHACCGAWVWCRLTVAPRDSLLTFHNAADTSAASC